MTALLDPQSAERLTKICGRFSSPFDGERAAAALLAHEFPSKHGLSWGQVFVPRAPQTGAEKIAFALANIGACSMWERGFLYSVNCRPNLSPKERRILDEIVEKVRAHAAGGRP